jgi:WD repeat-containing protein 44
VFPWRAIVFQPRYTWRLQSLIVLLSFVLYTGRPSKSKALSLPYLTADGRYLISAGKDSRVYIWNFADSGEAKSVHSCELFFSKDVTTAVPWPGVHQDRPVKACVCAATFSRHQGEGRRRCFAECTKGSATWPEEKLPYSSKLENDPQLGDRLSVVSAAWNTVIVTASRDGVIRSFPNYGLPVRL